MHNIIYTQDIEGSIHMKNLLKNLFLVKVLIILIKLTGLTLAWISVIKQGVEPIKPLFIVGAVLMFGSIIFEMIFLRCPHCNKELSSIGRLGDYCPHCGGRLDGED